ncbi:unnamed protein product [Nezara viridula]|uniref:Gustatory receptor n=1 Tax=Nezara viridula TaxID=85310 RepID=A0A9P0E1H3_NEZVI|nr:unnamed protein product [Nezara viridula]
MKVVSRHFSLLNKYAVVHACSKEIVNRFMEIHYELCEICQIVNEWFSLQLLFVCSLVFLATTLNLNAMFMALISFLDPLPPQITIFISSTFWVAARLYEMWEIFDACSKTEQNAEEFGGGLSKLMINEKMRNDNELLDIHFHVQPKLSITASGFFRLNNSLFQSMLASATTYIVIIIQVQPQMQGIVCPDLIYNGTAPVSS